ncbi:MAG: Flp pilus assembly complex ATPase component TadA [Fimbriimonadaceae bacterium]|nr:Flp pilus assembly complex ATPase component TadA [Fimbriimonadaceae bacterium]
MEGLLSSNPTLNRLSTRLGEILVADGVITDEQLETALKHRTKQGSFLGEALVALGYIPAQTLGRYLQLTMGFPYVELAETQIDVAIARRIPERIARQQFALPFHDAGDQIHVAMVDPLNLSVVDEISALLGRRVVPFLAFSADLTDAVNRVFDVKHKAESALQGIEVQMPPEESEPSVDELRDLGEEAPIVRLVNSIVLGAISNGASDIHIEPHEHTIRVRYRMDGIMVDQTTLPRHHLSAMCSRIKIVGHMNIAERRRPQDGRFSIRDENGVEFDLRVSVMPTVFGEKIVMRVLEKSGAMASLDKVGFLPDQRALFERFINRPHGIVLVTGPTGSGKSTTLYGALQQINDSTKNINTIEDPVEYQLDAINQVQVQPKIGLTFAAGLRTLVRQDPDVIMVGEIRDYETAEIAIQAALTGHLVLSTLHTNDAPGALVRLQNMGVEPFLVSSAILGVVGQRLVRTVCPSCVEAYTPSPDEVATFSIPTPNGHPPQLARGKGCTRCGSRGLRGRTGVYEVMPMTPSLREMVLARASGADLKRQAIADGMMTMFDAGMRKVLDRVTTPEEIVRVLLTED